MEASDGRPVTVKMRAGWDGDHITAVETAKACEAAGAALIAVHGRTREQMYIPGTVDWSVIAAVKAAVSVPVLGNGDITTADEARAMMEATGCDGVMVGRGALGNPWLFGEIAAMLKGEPAPPPPTCASGWKNSAVRCTRCARTRASGWPCPRPAARLSTI